MIRWLRVTWPPGWALAVAFTLWAGMDAVCLVAEWRTGILYQSLGIDDAPLVVLAMMASLYGLFRVAASHPIFRPGYYHWLCDAPWTAQKPLPLGPLHLVWQDLLLAALAVGLGWPRAGWQSLCLPMAFIIVYLIALGIANLLTGEILWVALLAFWLGVVVLLRGDAWGMLGSLAVGYVLASLGMKASLKRFPWQEGIAGWTLQEIGKDQSLGWPFDRLGPKFRIGHAVSTKDSLLIGILAGWWCFVLCLGRSEFDLTMAYFLLFAATLGGAIVRLMIYALGYAPPLSLFGRLVHLHWIIPGYDQVFVAPVLAILAIWSPAVLTHFHLAPPIYTMPLALTVSWWILLGMGPRLRDWRLTGNHRITPHSLAKAHWTK